MMSIPDLARQILSDMWEYGRLVLILVGVMAAWGFIISRFEDDREQSNTQGGLVLIALGTVGVFVLFSFLNVQAENILTLMRVSPAWGSFTSAVVFSAVVVFGITAYRYFAAKRTEEAITITGASEQMPRRAITNTIKLSWLIVFLLSFASIIWLWRLAKG
jgi:hypothetical protein